VIGYSVVKPVRTVCSLSITPSIPHTFHSSPTGARLKQEEDKLVHNPWLSIH